MLTEPVTVPADAKELLVRVYTADASVNVLDKVPASPPSQDATVLLIIPTRQQLKLEWIKSKASRQ